MREPDPRPSDAAVRARTATRRELDRLKDIRACLVRRIRNEGEPSGRWRENGEEHWLVVPDARALFAPVDMVGVGFFGRARRNVDHGPLLQLEADIVARAGSFRGLLAYHNVRFASGQWGTLVVLRDEPTAALLLDDAAHEQALKLAPAHYHGVRLHRVRAVHGICGELPLVWLRTLTHDFRRGGRRTVRTAWAGERPGRT